MMIKKVDRVMPRTREAFLTGTHEASVDSRQFGPVKQEQLCGKVIWHVKGSLSKNPNKPRRE
jgi:type IV secretory pathway protease TraF